MRALAMVALVAALATPARADELDDLVAQYTAALRTEKDPAEQDRLRRDLEAFAKLRAPAVLGSRWIQRDVMVIEGAFALAGDTVITAGTLVFKDRATIVTRGYRLLLDAREVVVGAGAAIDGSGAPGVPGVAGESRSDRWQSANEPDYWRAVEDCRRNPAHPDRGGPGSAGGAGGAGSVIVLRGAFDRGKLEIRVDGGKGGAGGIGGAGRLYLNGRNNYCNGCMANCPSGAQGPAGPDGPPGDIIAITPADPPPPPFLPFNGDSEYRVFESSKVAPGMIAVSVENLHPKDRARFEVWADSSGSTYSVDAAGGDTRELAVKLSTIERLVWVGHTTLPFHKQLDPRKGWRLQFRRLK